jgi:hypothetical protein
VRGFVNALLIGSAMNQRGSGPVNEVRMNAAVSVGESDNPAHAVKILHRKSKFGE